MYATYSKVETFADVPVAGPLDAKVRESYRLDFKGESAPDNTAEHAKDVATLANGFGGVILIGSKVDKDKGIVEHTGISRDYAVRLVEIYEQAAMLSCSPSPVVNAIIVEMPGTTRVLLAVNVDPMIHGPVGAKSGKGEDAWRFPMREASHTKYLLPNELSMYMNPKVRHALLLLDCIASDMVHLWVQPEANVVMGGAAAGPIALECLNAIKSAVDLTKNRAQFCVAAMGSKQKPNIPISVPLTEIDEVWGGETGDWNIRLAGRIETRSDRVSKFGPVAAAATQPSAVYIPVVR